MSKKITIAIDAMGGEDAPTKNIAGLIYFKKNKDKKIFILIFLVTKIKLIMN